MIPESTPFAETNRPPGGGGFRSKLRWLWRALWLVVLLPMFGACAWLWAMESWLRPAMLCRVPDWLWLAGCGAAGCGLLRWEAGPRLQRWRAAVVVAIFQATGLAGLDWGAQRLAVNVLWFDHYVAAGDEPPDALQRAIKQFFNERDAPTTKWASWYLQVKPDDMPASWHLLACGRWSVRLGFFRKLLATPGSVPHLSESWALLFPAVVGVDVDFRHRRKLLKLLDELRQSGELAPESRDTAILWQGLVFLSDPTEFAAWRVPVRDAMLAVEEPLLVRYGDVWMRTLDALLAYDPPELWPELTKPLAANPVTLRRAVRERVRGVLAHHEAFIRAAEVAEAEGKWESPFAAWQDCGRWLAAWPDTPWQAPVAEWRRTTLARWLLTEGLGGFGEQHFEYGKLLDRLPADAVIELAADDRAALAAKTFELAERAGRDSLTAADDDARKAVHQALMRVATYDPFLTAEQQTEARRLAAPALVRLAVFTTRWNAADPDRMTCSVCQACRKLLLKTWPLLTADQRATLAAEYRQAWEEVGRESLDIDLLCLDAWCERPALDEVEWLMSAASWGGWKVWRVVDETPRMIEWRAPFPVRRPAESTVKTVAQALERAVAGYRNAKGHRGDALAAFQEGLRSCHGGKPFPKGMEKGLDYFLNRASRPVQPFSGERWLAKRLAGMGLREPDAETRRALIDEVVAGEYGSLLLLPRDGFPDPWATVLQSPEIAAAEVVRDWEEDSDPLRSLLTAAVRTPPPAAVTAAMRETLLEKTRHGTRKEQVAAYGALFRLAPLVSADERLAMRREFLGFFKWQIVPMRSWPTWAMEPIETKRSVRGGEAIPWEDDALSAALSWSSEMRREVYRYPGPGVAERSAGVFSYLAQAFVSYEEAGIAPMFLDDYGIDKPIPERCWVRRPLTLPVEPTPWQRARALHLRRPDLFWPDCAWYRPGRE
jgi:hypothetical protein